MKVVLILVIFLIINIVNEKKTMLQDQPTRSLSSELQTWKLTFFDNFSDSEIAHQEAIDNHLNFDMNCYQVAPRCEYKFWEYKTCEGWDDENSEIRSNLKNLNKCTWQIYNLYNWMDSGIEEGKGVNAFRASQVKVVDGHLILKASKNSNWLKNKNCKNDVHRDGFHQYSDDCPIISGAIRSEPWKLSNQNEINGFEQTYGRWEVRAKLPKGSGIWPAFWMMPRWDKNNLKTLPYAEGKIDCGWPHIGEIDILETWSNNPNRAFQGYIHGHCAKDLDLRERFSNAEYNLVDEFHIYGVEWGEKYIKFYLDNKVTGIIWEGDEVHTKFLSGKKKGKAKLSREKAWIPDYPFFWILNLTIEGTNLRNKKAPPSFENFNDLELVIDYVKVYQACTKDEVENDPKHICKYRDLENDTVDNYQLKQDSKLVAHMILSPNPVMTSLQQEMNLNLVLGQECARTNINLYNSDGNNIFHVFSGKLEKNLNLVAQAHQFSIKVDQNWVSGFYILKGDFEGCIDESQPSKEQLFNASKTWKQILINN